MSDLARVQVVPEDPFQRLLLLLLFLLGFPVILEILGRPRVVRVKARVKRRRKRHKPH